ncbi:MAG: ribulose-phosphate 3-epimerase [Myxococcales bacterium]|nr:ribulose-phosphate 3-epimerase [Myxococcota bacterium]MDW8281571.1 ribulose-phosphate 3-epimerase [Myxococcales bacterium]
MPPLRIAPSILSADFGRLADEVARLTAAGADYIHVDVMDGHFVPNLTIGPPVVRALRRATHLPLDVHLMIERPEMWIERYAEAGADLIHVHAEACPHLHRVVQQIRSCGRRAVVALNPHTPLSVLDYVLEDLSMVLLMTVNPGFGGQSFIPQMLPKVRALRHLIASRGLQVDIEVDGGIKADNAAELVAAGANVLVAGSGIFDTPDWAATIAAMRKGAQALAR